MIRLILVSILALASLSAFAMDGGLNERSPWSDILASRAHNLVAPTATLTHEYGSLRASALNLCRRGDKVELVVGEIKVCTKQMQTRGGLVCVSYDRVKPVGPAVSTETYCAKEQYRGRAGKHCTEWKTYTTDLTQPVAVKVRTKDQHQGRFQQPGRTLFSKPYLVPACGA